MEEISISNIDFHHMYEAYQAIKNWLEGYCNENGEQISPVYDPNLEKWDFEKILLNKVKFIWYETKESDPIKIFTRLNIGKIALKDAELIKALFLNSTNFCTTNKEQIRLQQIEIASEWDRIEYALQDNEFWLFLHDLKYNKATRIDFIFDIIKRKDIFKLEEQLGKGCYEEAIGADEHQTLRYFYEYFKQNRSQINSVWLRKLWGVVKRYYQIFEEWYNDIELYHYVGYLIETGSNLYDIIERYNSNKQIFKKYLIEKIKERIKNCNNLDQTYSENGCKLLRRLLAYFTCEDDFEQIYFDDNMDSWRNYVLLNKKLAAKTHALLLTNDIDGFDYSNFHSSCGDKYIKYLQTYLVRTEILTKMMDKCVYHLLKKEETGCVLYPSKAIADWKKYVINPRLEILLSLKRKGIISFKDENLNKAEYLNAGILWGWNIEFTYKDDYLFVWQWWRNWVDMYDKDKKLWDVGNELKKKDADRGEKLMQLHSHYTDNPNNEPHFTDADSLTKELQRCVEDYEKFESRSIEN